MEKYKRGMSHDAEEWFKEKLIIAKYAFFVWYNRLEAVSARYSSSVEKFFDNYLGWNSFYS